MHRRRFLITGVVVAFMVLTVVPAAAGPGGTDRPFKAELIGELTFDIGTDCPNPMGVLTKTESWGNATHLGAMTADWAHCPLGSGFFGSEVDFVAANGDRLHLEYPTNPEGNPFVMYVDGGTGRFEDATGTLNGVFWTEPQFIPGCEPTPEDPCYNPFVPWPWGAEIEGTISY